MTERSSLQSVVAMTGTRPQLCAAFEMVCDQLELELSASDRKEKQQDEDSHEQENSSVMKQHSFF